MTSLKMRKPWLWDVTCLMSLTGASAGELSQAHLTWKHMFLTCTSISLPILAKLVCCHLLGTWPTPQTSVPLLTLALSGVLLCHGLCSVILRGHFKGSLSWEAPLGFLLSPYAQSRLLITPSSLQRSLHFVLHLNRLFPQLHCMRL